MIVSFKRLEAFTDGIVFLSFMWLIAFTAGFTEGIFSLSDVVVALIGFFGVGFCVMFIRYKAELEDV